MAHAQLASPSHPLWQQRAQPTYASVQLLPKPAHSGTGLQANGRQLWPQWEGRIGVAIDQPSASGLQLRSFHILSDYRLHGGFRATAGLIQGRVDQAWWSGSTQQGGMNLSVQRLNNLRLAGEANQDQRTMAYVGAGYSLLINADPDDDNPSHFNADIGLTAVSSKDGDRQRISATDGLGGNPLGGKLKWRPLIKFSVDYAF